MYFEFFVSDGAGEWEFSSCKTIILSLDKVLCECKDVGAIALIKVSPVLITLWVLGSQALVCTLVICSL